MAVARHIPGFLHIHAEVDHIGDYLSMALRLHTAAHQTKAHQRFAVFHDKGRDDGVERAFPGCVDIGMAFLEGEQLTPVLQHETQTIRNKAGPHTPVIALNEADHHAVLIGDREINGVPVFQHFRVRIFNFFHGLFHVDHCASFGGIFF